MQLVPTASLREQENGSPTSNKSIPALAQGEFAILATTSRTLFLQFSHYDRLELKFAKPMPQQQRVDMLVVLIDTLTPKASPGNVEISLAQPYRQCFLPLVSVLSTICIFLHMHNKDSEAKNPNPNLTKKAPMC